MSKRIEVCRRRGQQPAIALVGVALGVLVYARRVLPRMRRWGATGAEVEGAYPGSEIIPDGHRWSTMAATLPAPPDQVWPWLVQMGYGRAGWYSWDRLDNWGHRSATRIHPEWQDISVGSRLPATADGTRAFVVAALEKNRFLALRSSYDLTGHQFDPAAGRPRHFTDSTWCFALNPTSSGGTRVVVSGYAAGAPAWFSRVTDPLIFEPAHYIMQRKQFRNLAQRVAVAAREAPQEGV